MTAFKYIYRTLWFILFLLIIFIDRSNLFMILGTLILLALLTSVLVLRIIESRNQWRKYLKDHDIEM